MSLTAFQGAGEWRVYSPFSKPIGTLYPVKATNVAWTRNGISTATFSIPKAGLRWSSSYVQPWNRVEFHHASLPYVWTGVIIGQQPGDTDVAISCQSSEVLYSRRHTDLLHDLNPEWTMGMAIVDLHHQAVAYEPLGIELGAIDLGGPTYWSTFYLAPCSEAMTTVAEAAGGEWWVEKTVHDHSHPVLRYARSRGANRWGTVLVCGDIVDLPDFQRQAPDLATVLYAIGKEIEVPGGKNDALGPYAYREVVPLIDEAARKLYGRIEAKEEFDTDELSVLQEMGRASLDARCKPVKTFGLNVDNRRGVWGSFWLGDTIRVMAARTDYDGLDAAVRVDGIQIDVDTQKMGLVVTLL